MSENSVKSIDVIKILSDNNFDIAILDSIKENLYLQFDTKGFNLEIDWNIAKCLSNYQRMIYETYCFAKYGKKDLRRLTTEENEKLCLRFKIKSGSTDYLASIKEILSTMLNSLPEKDRKWAILAVVTALFAGFGSYLYFNHKNEVLKQQTLIEEQQNVRLAISELSKLAKGNVIADKAIQNIVSIEKETAEKIENAKTDMIINGERYSQKEISYIVQEYKKRISQEQLPTSKNIKGRYTVKNIQVETPYIITLRNSTNGEIVKATYTPNFLDDNVLKSIKKALDNNEIPNFEFTINYSTDEKGNKSTEIIEIK